MMIIGCDFHPSWQQVSWLDMETGETGERKLLHGDGEAERFYRQVAAPALIGMEATGNCHWLVERRGEEAEASGRRESEAEARSSRSNAG
jgi:transposase